MPKLLTSRWFLGYPLANAPVKVSNRRKFLLAADGDNGGTRSHGYQRVLRIELGCGIARITLIHLICKIGNLRVGNIKAQTESCHRRLGRLRLALRMSRRWFRRAGRFRSSEAAESSH